MKKKIFVIITILIVVAIFLVIIFVNHEIKQSNGKGNVVENQVENENSENETIEELKKSVNATADSNIYEVGTEYDGRQVLSVKSSTSFNVAFAGTINKDLKTVEEANNTIKEKIPTKTGIYLKDENNEFLKYINEYCLSKYNVTEDGYLAIKEDKEKNEFDSIIQNAIKNQKTYFIYCDGEIKNIDNITGEIMNYDFENIDPYQAYEYIQDNDKIFIELSTNKKNKLTSKEIFEATIELIKNCQ